MSEALGKPIEIIADGYDPNINEGTMDLEIDLEGQNADGSLRVIARKTGEDWEYSVFTITVKNTGQVIDLKDKINN